MRERYGAGPAHLAGVIACLLVGGYALARFLFDSGPTLDLIVWIAGAIALHDFVLFPLYTAFDRGLQRATSGAPRVLNHLRIPSALAALVFLVYFPLILRLGPDHLRSAAALDRGPYLGRWLIITVSLFAISAIVYVIRLLRSR